MVIERFYMWLPWLFIGLAAGDEIVTTGNDESGRSFSAASCELTVNLLRSLTSLKNSNVVLSPSSVGVVLAILQQGARENTLAQIDKALYLTADESRIGNNKVLRSLQGEKTGVMIKWGNRAYIRPGIEINENFNATIRENFDAIMEELNFVEPSPQEAAKVINEWIKEETQDKIVDLISPSLLTADTLLVLVNAIYFKGLWDIPFKKMLTKQDKFELEPQNSVEVPFMSQKERFVAGVDPESGIQWVDLPFKDEQFSMLFLLPLQRHDLPRVVKVMSGDLLKKIIRDEQTRQVTLKIPKFKLNQRVLLSEALKEVGLRDIFTADSNLEGISPTFKNLMVSKIIHQANVEIDEDGSTASATTGLILEVLSFPKTSDHLTFKADHPFLFFILDRKNQIPLFAGKVADPS